MAIALLRKVALRGDMVAFAAWLLPDGFTIVEVKVPQKEYDAGNVATFGQPDPDAVFLCGSGGISALTTEDGYPRAGDYWETIDNGVPALHVARSDSALPQWSSWLLVNDDALAVASKGQHVTTKDYDAKQPDQAVFDAKAELAPTKTVTKESVTAVDASAP